MSPSGYIRRFRSQGARGLGVRGIGAQESGATRGSGVRGLGVQESGVWFLLSGVQGFGGPRVEGLSGVGWGGVVLAGASHVAEILYHTQHTLFRITTNSQNTQTHGIKLTTTINSDMNIYNYRTAYNYL